MSKKRIILIVVVLAAAVFAVSRIVTAEREKRITQSRIEADRLYRDERYQEAADIYAKLGDEEKLEKCRERLAFEAAKAEARELLDAGKPEEALERLKAYPELADPELPGHDLYREISESLAAGLLERGEAEQALTLLGTNAPDSPFLSSCEQAFDEQQFRALLDAGDPDGAGERLAAIEKSNDDTHRLTDEQLREMRSAYKSAVTRRDAEQHMAEGRFRLAFDKYEELEDADGMRSALDALEAAGDFGLAFPRAVRMGDIPRADALFERLAEDRGTLIDNIGGLTIGETLSGVLKSKEDGAAELAGKMAGAVVETCRAMIAEGKRSIPYYALEELKERAGEIWTEDDEALMAGCLETPPKSGILSDDGLSKGSGTSAATITVFNNSSSAAALLLMRADDEYGYGGDRIVVLVQPGKYTFTVEAGTYKSSLMTGKHWFGSKEVFGVRESVSEVVINNGMNNKPTNPANEWKTKNRLEGSYSITIG